MEQQKLVKDILFEKFKSMFPAFAENVVSYKRIGSQTISMKMEDGSTKLFLYSSPKNWNFGTKLWRKKPDPIPKGTKPKVKNRTEAQA